jgi:hypothetical protein
MAVANDAAVAVQSNADELSTGAGSNASLAIDSNLSPKTTPWSAASTAAEAESSSVQGVTTAVMVGLAAVEGWVAMVGVMATWLAVVVNE